MRDEELITERLAGAWDLVEWSLIRPDGSEVFPLGEQAAGQLVYTVEGHVSAQLVAAGRVPFRSDDWREASSEEAARAFKEYFGYFGTFSVEAEQGAVIHHVVGGWFPNLEGRDQLRFYRFEGNQLVLKADTAWGKVKIVWRRADAANRNRKSDFQS